MTGYSGCRWTAARLPELLLPKGGLLAVLEAYFDESGRPGGTFAVGGYVFLPKHHKKFDAAWRRLMYPFWPFHMKEFVHRRDKIDRRTTFESLSDADRDRLIRDAVKIINRHTKLCISIACNSRDVERLRPGLRGLNSAYSVCCHMCMVLLGMWIERNKLPHQVAYVFEAGNEFQAEAEDVMRGAQRDSVTKQHCRYKAHAFVDKADASALQAADLFVWELTKFLDETVGQRRLGRPIRPPRASLRALVQPDPSRYEGRVIDGEQLEQLFDKIRRRIES